MYWKLLNIFTRGQGARDADIFRAPGGPVYWGPVAGEGAGATALGLFVGICVAQTDSLFSSDAWNNITFTAGEVRDPRRNIPLSLLFGTALVITLYLLANVAYLCVLPLTTI